MRILETLPSSRSNGRIVVAVAVALLLGNASQAGMILRVPEPELVFKAETTELEPGVHIARTADEFRTMALALTPSPDEPALEEATLLLIVGDDRSDDCRQTVLDAADTRLRTARVTLAEHRGGPGCRCSAREPSRAVFGVLVAPMVKKAKLEVVPVTLDCGASAPRTTVTGPAGAVPMVEEILSGTLVEAEPGARLIGDADEWLAFCARMNQEDSCPAVDFTRSRVVVAVGRPLQNACRRTASEGVTVDGAAARVVLREIHPGAGRICAQVFGGYQVFAFRVPAAVVDVSVDSRRVE